MHKKGDQSDPANFRPITLECTPLKMFTSCLRDSMFAFLSANGYIEHRIQKGFMPKLSSTYEHTNGTYHQQSQDKTTLGGHYTSRSQKRVW